MTTTVTGAGEDAREGLRRAVDPAQGGPAARPGPGHVLRRRAPARDGLRPLRPLAVRAREDHLDRRREGARARGRLRDDHRRRGRDPHGSLLRDVRRAGREHQGLRARGRARAAHGRAGRGRLRRDARARARRRRADRGRVRRAAGARRRRGVAEGRGRPPRRRRLERRLVGRLRLGRRRHRARRGRPRREDRPPPLPPLLVDAARVRGCARRVRQGHGRVDAALQPPDARGRRDLDGAGAPHGDRQAPLRHAGHRRRLRQQDLPPPAVRRALPPGAQARPAGAVDGVAHRPAHRERTRQRALVPRRRGRRHGRRDDDRVQGASARRLRRVPPLRAARLHHLGAGHARDVRLAEHPSRLHAGLHEQVARVAEPRLLADAAPVADRADRRHRRHGARLRPGRDPEEELRQDRADAVRDAERLLLRLRRLRGSARHRARAHRPRLHRGEACRSRVTRKAPRPRDRLDARLRHEQLRAVDAAEPRPAVLGQQRSRLREARHLRRGRGHARHRSAGAGTRDDRGAGRRPTSSAARPTR